MNILIKAKPGAKKERVESTSGLFTKNGERRFIVAVKEPAKEGRANDAVERALADHFGISRSRVRIVSGHTSRDKIVEIEGLA